MERRYSSLNQAPHWITAGCMFAILPLAWVMTNMKPDAAYREDLFNWHKTLGVIVLFITAFRAIWRAFDGPPPYPQRVAFWERRLAHAAYWIFFLVLFWMPITGFLTSYSGGHPIKLFDLVPTSDLLPRDKAWAAFFDSLHLAGQWAIYALIVLHLAAITLRTVCRRTGILGRMLPATAIVPEETASPRG
jgi:cytochrome b561